MEYSSPARDPSSSEDITKLENVQRKGTRFVHNNYYDRTPGCVSKMVSDLGWKSLQYRRRVDRLTTLYKIQYGLMEIDTDVVRPSDKRARDQNRLYQPAATLSSTRTPSSQETFKNGTFFLQRPLMLSLWRSSESV